jgi:O-methyltransferase
LQPVSVWNDIVRNVTGWAGYEVRREHAQPAVSIARCLRDACLAESLEIVRSYTMLSHTRLVTLHRQVRYLDRVGMHGALVECGTWKGGAAGMMAMANLESGAPPRHLHLFEAFDTIVDARRLLEKEICYEPSYVHFHEGWLDDTVPVDASAIGDIALLRLDGALQVSIEVCLEHLFDRVVPGGFVIVDGYGHYDECTYAVDEFIEANGLEAQLHPAVLVPGCHMYWIKR